MLMTKRNIIGKIILITLLTMMLSLSVVGFGASRSISGNQVTLTIDPSGGTGVASVQEKFMGSVTITLKPAACGYATASKTLTCDYDKDVSGTIVYTTSGSGTVSGLIVSGNLDPAVTGDSTIPKTAATICGNNKKETGEVCDGADLGANTCVQRGYAGGTLACAANCKSFVVSGCTATAPTTLCKDSDSGSDIYNQRTVTVGTDVFTDTCSVTADGSQKGKTGPYVYEYICGENDKEDSEVIACPSGTTCNDGACVTTTSSSLCKDGDSKNTLIRTTSIDKNGVSWTDECVGAATITEYFCVDDILNNQVYPCAAGEVCQQGACVTIIPPDGADLTVQAADAQEADLFKRIHDALVKNQGNVLKQVSSVAGVFQCYFSTGCELATYQVK